MSACALRQRVRCTQCDTHRLHPFLRCGCGADSFAPVQPTGGDLAALTEDAIAAAEDVDWWLHAGHTLRRDHPQAQRLAQACQILALARAGVLTR